MSPSFVVRVGDARLELAKMPENYVALTVTSPPYDTIRDYEGYVFEFEAIAAQLFRVTVQGGVVVWVVGDKTINGSESGTSFKQALYFKEIGFNLHDTMIYRKSGPPQTHRRYEQHFEYMFVLSKGKPRTFNGIREASTYAGQARSGGMRQDSDALNKRNATGVVAETKLLGNVWDIVCSNGGTPDEFAHNHPAIFPEELAHRHILSWSNVGEIVLDPMCGSGTTGKMALKLHRHFIGIDISAEYCALTQRRLEQAQERM